MIRDTSRDAYRKAMPRMAPRQAAIVSYLLDHPEGVAADEYRRAINEWNPSSVAPDFTALEKAKVIEDSGLRRRTEKGRMAIVWQLRGIQAIPAKPWTGCKKSIVAWHDPVPVGQPCKFCGERRPAA